MLTAPPHGHGVGWRSPTRWLALRAAVVPTARIAGLPSAAVIVGLATAPMLAPAIRDKEVGAPVFIAACLIGGAVLGLAADDPAAELLAAAPVPSAARTSLRTLLVACTSVLVMVAGSAVAAFAPGDSPSVRERIPASVAAACTALAIALGAARRGDRAAGAAGVVGGLLVTGTIGSLATRWPTTWPSLEGGPTNGRWWIVVAAACAGIVGLGRDPGARRLRDAGVRGRGGPRWPGVS